MLTLPSLPPGIRTLTDEEAMALRVEYPPSDLPPNPANCITCRGTKKFTWYTTGRVETAEYECPCIDQWILHRFFLNSNVGLSYQRLGWDDVVAEPGAVAKVQDYLTNVDGYLNAGYGLILFGGTGTGKTMLSTMLLKKLLAEGHDGYFTTFAGMVDIFMSSWHDAEKKSRFYKRIKNAKVLVLDDIGREHRQRQYLTKEERQKQGSESGIKKITTAVAESSFDEVLRHRVANCKTTIITTNLDLDEIEIGYGANIMSLLRERSTTYRFTGEDFRDAQRNRLKDEIDSGLVRPVVIG